MEAAADAAFVLVAGGLGERLGYSGIKLALPSESATGACFLQARCRCPPRCSNLNSNCGFKLFGGNIDLSASARGACFIHTLWTAILPLA